MIGTISKVNPEELNRGQVIHFPIEKKGLSLSKSIDYDDNLSNNQIVEKSKAKNVVFCDWFEITIMLPNVLNCNDDQASIELFEGLILESKNQKTKTYNNVWDVIYLGEFFGTLMTDPIYSYINPLRAQFKIDNRHLYRCDWLDDVKDIIAECKWKHVSNTRIDIAIDGEAGSKCKSIVARHLKGSTIGRKGKAVMSIGYNRDKSISKYHIGSTKSDKTATIYNKKNEIESSEKSYIEQAWKHNNLDVKSDVNRFELRMRSKVANRYDWTKLDDLKYMASIAMTECKNWFEFYYDGKDKNRYRAYKTKTMEWIDWDSIAGELLPKSKPLSPTGINRAKRIVKDLTYMEYVESKKVPLHLIDSLKSEYCLHKWYDDKIGYWKDQWNRDLKYRNMNSN